MGDRVSISFVKDGKESVALFHHWGGYTFHKQAKQFLREVKVNVEKLKREKPNFSDPYMRMDPETMIVYFIAWLKDRGELSTSLYLGKDKSDGDNSNNGHYVIDVDTLADKHYE